MRPDEDGAGDRCVEPGSELSLPVAAGRQGPLVQPRLDPGALQASSDLLNDRSITAVVGQEDVEALRGSAHRLEARGLCSALV